MRIATAHPRIGDEEEKMLQELQERQAL